MKTILLILLALFSSSALAVDPEIGTHYATGPVAYETTEFLVMRDGLTINADGTGMATNILWKGDTPDQAVISSYLLDPSYDKREKAQFKRLLSGYALDLVSTGLGRSCSEIGVIAKASPALSLGLAIWYVSMTRRDMVNTPKFHSVSHLWLPDINATTHGLAGIRNLSLGC